MTIWPTEIRLEASSACQLKCPSCPTATGATKAAVGTGFLRKDDFARLIADNPWLTRIELSNYGEVFLNPHLLAILEIAQRERVALSIANGANLNHVRDGVLEGLVKYGVRYLTCSIDGASPETYKLYRRGGDFDRVIGNIEAINRYKRRYGSDLPRLSWQFVVFGHNEAEIPRAREMAQALGMNFYTKLSWDADFSPVRDEIFVKRETGSDATSRAEYERSTGEVYLHDICHQLWTSPQINFDGKVLGCCRNFWGDFGRDAFGAGLIAAVNSEKMSYARAMLRGEQPTRADIPCSSCEIYDWRRDKGAWVGADLREVEARPAAQGGIADAIIGPEWAAALRSIAARLRKGERDREIEPLFDAVRSETTPPVAAAMALARAAERRGWLDEAESLYGALTTAHPDEPSAFLALARLALRRRAWGYAARNLMAGIERFAASARPA
jgi:MoaA/NifB/PqqE/SkfB family radical SAM enzyme